VFSLAAVHGSKAAGAADQSVFIAAVHGNQAAGRCSECSLQLLFMEISELLFSVLYIKSTRAT